MSNHSEKPYSVKGTLQYFRNGTASAVVFDIFQIILVDYCHGCSCSILTNIVLWTGASELVSAVPFAPSLVPEAGHTWILTPRFEGTSLPCSYLALCFTPSEVSTLLCFSSKDQETQVEVGTRICSWSRSLGRAIIDSWQ